VHFNTPLKIDNHCSNEVSSPVESGLVKTILRMGSVLVFISTLGLLYYISPQTNANVSGGEFIAYNSSKANSIIHELCASVKNGKYTGDFCNYICSDAHNWSIVDFHEGGSKSVIKFRDNGKDIIMKMHHPFAHEYDTIDDRVSEDELTDKVLEIVNEHVRLGWAKKYKSHLLRRLWPTYKSTQPLSIAERRSLWALLQQNEFINMRLLPLSRVTPQVIATCGHAYRSEYLIPFKMKSYYMSLKAKILIHLMGTLKLFDEFLNEPLQWCDVKFENLGLSADYPKRFVVMDNDMLFTESKLNSMLMSQRCENDTQCSFFDCESICLVERGHCSKRVNDNIDVFCKKLISQLFNNFWSKSNKYLAACHTEGPVNTTKRLNELRLVWSWTLSDI